MAKDKSKRKPAAALSFRSADAIDVGLFSSGRATIKESIFSPYTYKGSNKPVDVWLITFSRKGEEDYEQPYGIGKGWKVSEDGTSLIPKNNQTGLPKSCNAMMYLVKPIEAACKKQGLDPDDYLSGDPSALDGLEVVVARIDQEKRDNQKERADGMPRSILRIEEIVIGGKPAKGGKKAKPADDDEEDEDTDTETDEDEDDDDEDEKPAKRKGKGKTKPKPAADDDDEDEDEADDDDDVDEPPAKKKPAKGKAKPAADDEDEADDDEGANDELLEEGTEALIAALEEADTPIKLGDLADALTAQLKGNKARKAIVAMMIDPDVLSNEKGWTYNTKKKVVTLD